MSTHPAREIEKKQYGFMASGSFWAFLAAFVLICSSAATAATYVNRVYDNPNPPYYRIVDVTLGTSTWNTGGSPYITEATVSVGAGAVLTIQSGVSVQVSPGRGIYVNGNISATGTTFSTYGTGKWLGIYLSPASGGSSLDQCVIQDSGGYNNGYGLGDFHGWKTTAIFIDGSSPSITNSTISNSQTHGVELWSSAAIIQNNVFQNMGDGYYAMVYDTTDTYPAQLSGNSSTGTGHNGIALPGGAVAVSGILRKPGANFPYFLNSNLTVNNGVALTLSPGVTIKNSFVGIYILGTLTAQGTATNPIVLTSRQASPAPGNWLGVYFGPDAGGSVLKYATISYSGAYNNGYGLGDFYGWKQSSVVINSSNPAFTNLTISNSETNGIWLYASNSVFSTLSISSCGWSGLRTDAGSRPSITTANFTGNGAGGYYTISLDAASVPNPASVTFSSNSYQGVQIRGGTMTSDALWKNWSSNAPYAVTGNVTVNTGVTLTIQQGTTVKLWYSAMYINGVLNSNGSPGRINFTSLRDDTIGGDTNGDGSGTVAAPGNWLGLYLGPGAGSSIMNNCAVSFSGGYNNGYGLGDFHGWRKTSVLVDSSSPSLFGLRVTNSETNGIELYASNANITYGRLESNGWTGLVAGGNSNPSVSHVNFIGSTAVSGFTNSNTAIAINARQNYWGAATGPYDPSDDRPAGGLYNPGGGGVSVSNGIDYSSWLTAEDGGEYHLITASAGRGGSISPSGLVDVTHGADQEFDIIAAAGYDISDVIVDGVSQGPLATFTFTAVITSHTIEAVFVRAADMINAGDVNGNGADDLAALKTEAATDINYVYVRDGMTGALIQTLNFGAGCEFIDLKAVADINGNGAAEIAVLCVDKTTSGVRVTVKDALSGGLLSEIPYDSIFAPVTAVVVPDINGNSIDEIGVLGVNSSTGTVRVQIKDASTKALLKNILYDSNFAPVTAVVVPDINGNSFDEIGVLGVNSSSGAVSVQVRDSSTKALLKNILYDSNFAPVTAVVVPDINSNSFDEIGVLGVNPSTDAVRVQIKDSSTKALIGNITYDSTYVPVTAVLVPDINGNSFDEIGVLGVHSSTGAVSVQVKDSSTKGLIKNVTYDKNYPPVTAVPMADLSGNSLPEMAVLGENPTNSSLRAIVKDISANALIRNIPVP